MVGDMKKIILILGISVSLVSWAGGCNNSQENPFPFDVQQETSQDITADVSEPPVVTIISPTSHAILEGVQDCIIQVKDPMGGKVKAVQVGLFDIKTKKPTVVVSAQSDNTGKFKASVDTAKDSKGKLLPDGDFALVAIASMEDGRKAQAAIQVKVDNLAPAIALAQPRPNGNFMGNLKMVLAVTDHGGSGVRYVKLMMGGKVLDSVESAPDKPIVDMKPIVFVHSSKDWMPGKLTFTLEAMDNRNHKTTKSFDVNYVEQPIFLTGKFVDQGDFKVDSMCTASGPGSDRIVTVGPGGLIYWVWSDRAQNLVPNQLASKTGNKVLCSDLNNDGIDDIMVGDANGKSTDFITYLGNKEGGYTYSSRLTIPQQIVSFTLGDLSGDNAPELVGVSADTNKAMFLSKNDGKGIFEVPSEYGGISDVGQVVIADLTEDGMNDILISRNKGGLVTLFPGNGDGTVAIGLNSSLDINKVDFLVSGKLEPGSDKDRVMAVDSAKSTLYTITKKGIIPFTVTVSGQITTALGPTSIAYGDINKDNLIDVVAICKKSNLVAIFFGNNDGSFQAVHWYEAGGGEPDQVVLADVNRDGFKDIVVLNKKLSRFTILLFEKALYTPGDISTASFHGPQQIFLKGKIHDLGVGHFHTKDQFDAAVLSTITDSNGDIRDSILIYNGKNGIFQQEPIVAESFVEKRNGFVVSDLDKNGLDDFVVTGQSSDPNTSLKLIFSRSHGYSSSSTPGYIDPMMVGVGDIASLTASGALDGYPDLAVVSQVPNVNTGETVTNVSIMLNNGNGTFTQLVGASYPLDKAASPTDIMLAKLHSNVFPDLFVASEFDVAYFPTTAVGGYYNETNQKRLAMGNGLRSLFLGYLGGGADTSPDLVALATKDKSIAISYNLGVSHMFNPPVSLKYSGSSPVIMKIKDLNLDRYPDIIVLDKSASVVNVFMNLGSSQFSQPYSFSVGSGPIAMSIKDINNDGCNDILTLDEAGETVTVLLNLLCQQKQ